MLNFTSRTTYYLSSTPTDMRNGREGLAGIIREKMQHDPYSYDEAFIFLCRLGIGNLWKCLKSLGVSIRNRLVDYWYVLVFLVTTIYVLSNFKVCIDLSFTEDFNGNNLIFLFWLVLIIFPMFESFEGFGISIKKRKQKKTEDMLTMEYHNNLVDAQEKGGNDE